MARDLAEQEGYDIPPENEIGIDWGSLSVWDSPAMERLKALIRDRSINAVFLYDADRGPSKPVHAHPQGRRPCVTNLLDEYA